MNIAYLKTILARDLRAVKREIEAYPDEASVWRVIPGTPNTGGTLALHLAGNLQHFFGSILARDGYVRDRDAEFARRDVPRRELLAGLDAAIASIDHTLDALGGSVRDGTWVFYDEKRKSERTIVYRNDRVLHQSERSPANR